VLGLERLIRGLLRLRRGERLNRRIDEVGLMVGGWMMRLQAIKSFVRYPISEGVLKPSAADMVLTEACWSPS